MDRALEMRLEARRVVEYCKITVANVCEADSPAKCCPQRSSVGAALLSGPIFGTNRDILSGHDANNEGIYNLDHSDEHRSRKFFCVP